MANQKYKTPQFTVAFEMWLLPIVYRELRSKGYRMKCEEKYLFRKEMQCVKKRYQVAKQISHRVYSLGE